MNFRPLLHGSYVDDIAFAVIAVVSLVLFFVLAFLDKRKHTNENSDDLDS